jgi:hypothetical protein
LRIAMFCCGANSLAGLREPGVLLSKDEIHV